MKRAAEEVGVGRVVVGVVQIGAVAGVVVVEVEEDNVVRVVVGVVLVK